MGSVTGYVRRARATHLRQLQELLSIPSVSTDSRHAKDVRRAAEWVRKRLKSAGCTKTELHKTPRHPIVYGEWLGAPGAPTVLVYGHYDVQPADPLELWSTPPFEPVVRNGKIFARGASDNKGQFLAHVNALEAHLQSHGRCPVNVKFLIEGEEEIGSPNLDAFIAKNRNRLACDVAVVSDSAMFAKGLPAICYGLRGLAYLELQVRGTDRDLHSGSFGGAVINPANALVSLLASLKDNQGRVAVPGFYEKVRRLRPAERKAFAGLPHSDARYKRSIGAPELYGETGYTTLERIWARPTLDINGIWGGFTGEGAKTVIPAEASRQDLDAPRAGSESAGDRAQDPGPLQEDRSAIGARLPARAARRRGVAHAHRPAGAARLPGVRSSEPSVASRCWCVRAARFRSSQTSTGG